MPLHLLALWNPAYSGTAMDAHLDLLLKGAARRGAEGAGEGAGDEEPYVWWAKLRSENRQSARPPHADDVLALQAQIDAGTETHLYLTDYRSLYVGLLDEITADNILADSPDEADHMPAYYRGRPVDFWFRLLDLRRLVADDTEDTIRTLQALRNTRYHDRPVSLYGGMVDLPLIVRRDDEITWFADRDTLTDGRLWAEHDARNRSETERLARELRDHLLSPAIWDRLEPATRSFLASGEAIWRARAGDPGFDFSGPAVEYAKAVEAELNALVFPSARKHLKSRAPADREVLMDGTRLDLGGRVPHQTLGAIRTLLQKNDTFQKALTQSLPHDHKWLLGELPPRIQTLSDLRNPAAHSGLLSREDAREAREQVLGIGCEGLIVKLARVRMRAGV